MDIDGTGITTVTFKTLPDFRARTTLAIKWRQLESGNWSGLDRTDDEDIYETTVGIYGTESVINNFIDEVEDNRQADDHVLKLSNFFSTEYIFGENVDHSVELDATIVNYNKRTQGSLNGWGLIMRLRLIETPAFTGASSLPTLNYVDVGVSADANYTINKKFTYDLSPSYHDHVSDNGIFEGTFTLAKTDMQTIRNHIKDQRTGNFVLADTFGIDYPFGTRSTGSYPFTVKLIGWEDLGMFGLKWHRIKLTFAEII